MSTPVPAVLVAAHLPAYFDGYLREILPIIWVARAVERRR